MARDLLGWKPVVSMDEGLKGMETGDRRTETGGRRRTVGMLMKPHRRHLYQLLANEYGVAHFLESSHRRQCKGTDVRDQRPGRDRNQRSEVGGRRSEEKEDERVRR